MFAVRLRIGGRPSRAAVLLLAQFTIGLLLTESVNAQDAAKPIKMEAAQLEVALRGTQKVNGNEDVLAPSGTFKLCALPPDHVFRMLSKSHLMGNELRNGWAAYVSALAEWYRQIAQHDDELLAAAEIDQIIRNRLIQEMQQPEPTGSALPAIQAVLCLVDRANAPILRNAIDGNSWPRDGEANGGRRAEAAFLLYQHVPLTETEYDEFFGLIDSAFREGAIEPFDYARAYDRHSLRRSKGQKYGTQYIVESGRRIVADSLGCAAEINKERALIGVEPIENDIVIQSKTGTCA